MGVRVKKNVHSFFSKYDFVMKADANNTDIYKELASKERERERGEGWTGKEKRGNKGEVKRKGERKIKRKRGIKRRRV